MVEKSLPEIPVPGASLFASYLQEAGIFLNPVATYNNLLRPIMQNSSGPKTRAPQSSYALLWRYRP